MRPGFSRFVAGLALLAATVSARNASALDLAQEAPEQRGLLELCGLWLLVLFPLALVGYAFWVMLRYPGDSDGSSGIGSTGAGTGSSGGWSGGDGGGSSGGGSGGWSAGGGSFGGGGASGEW